MPNNFGGDQFDPDYHPEFYKKEVITIRRKKYTVTKVEENSDPRNNPRYVLVGAHGAEYTTMRNVHQRDKMFLVHAKKGFGIPSGFKGLWLTDENGELEVVRE